MQCVKCVIVGDAAVGKSSLLLSYTTNAVPHDYVPTIFDNYSAHVATKEAGIIDLVLWDLGGSHEYQQLRPLSYKTAQVFLVTFAIDNRESFASVSSLWVPEIRACTLCHTPWILVGTKTDLRADPSSAPHLVSEKEAILAANQLNALQYMEVSAWTQEGLHELFQAAIQVAIQAVSQNAPFKRTFQKKSSFKRAFCCSLL